MRGHPFPRASSAVAVNARARLSGDGVRSLVGLQFEHDLEQASGSPLSVDSSDVGGSLVGAEDRFEPQEAADQNHQILERAMTLLANRALTLLDEHAGGRHVRHVLQQKSAEAFPRRVEAGRCVQPADERQQIGERDFHCARASTMAPDGAGRPGAGSSVTRTPVSGRGALGGVSVAEVARPEASGSNVPALTALSADSSQIW